MLKYSEERGFYKEENTFKFISDVEDAVNLIKADSGKSVESAHIMEDDLYKSVLKAIANGTVIDSSEDMANAALKAEDLDFTRWYS